MTDAILFILVTSLTATNPEAASKATEAYYKQSGAERAINQWTERQFEPELRAKAGSVSFIAKTLVEQRVSFELRFP